MDILQSVQQTCRRNRHIWGCRGKGVFFHNLDTGRSTVTQLDGLDNLLQKLSAEPGLSVFLDGHELVNSYGWDDSLGFLPCDADYADEIESCFEQILVINDSSDLTFALESMGWRGGNERSPTVLTVDPDDGTVRRFDPDKYSWTELFRIETPHEITLYIELLRAKSSPPQKKKPSKASLDRIIDKVWVPYRDPQTSPWWNTEDGSTELRPSECFVSFDKVAHLLKKSAGQKWLTALEHEKAKTEWIEDSYRTWWSDEENRNHTQFLTERIQESIASDAISPAEYEKIWNDTAPDDWFTVTPNTENVYLHVWPGSKEAKISRQPTHCEWPHGNEFSLLIATTERVVPQYFAMLLRVTEGGVLREVLDDCIRSGSFKNLKSTFIKLPSRREQLSIWFSWKILQHSIRQVSQKLPVFDVFFGRKKHEWNLKTRQWKELPTPSLEDSWRRYKVRNIVCHQLNDKEEDRYIALVRPLPTFLELFVSSYRSAPTEGTFRLQAGFTLLKVILQTTALMAIAEQAGEKKQHLPIVLGEDLAAAMLARPSDGLWLEIVKRLNKTAGEDLVTSKMIDVLHQKKERLSSLISYRNDYAHGWNLVPSGELKRFAAAYDETLVEVISLLRECFSQVHLWVAHERQWDRTTETHTLRCDFAMGAVPPFESRWLRLKPDVANSIQDSELFLFNEKSEQVVMLDEWFTPVLDRRMLNDILFYERDGDKKDPEYFSMLHGRVRGIANGNQK